MSPPETTHALCRDGPPAPFPVTTRGSAACGRSVSPEPFVVFLPYWQS